MNNFYTLSENHIFNATKYLLEWKKQIGIDFSDEEVVKKKVQSLSSHVKNLWINFNENRTELKKDYMDTNQGIQAYLASFLLSNIERAFGVLTSDENLNVLEYLLWQEQDEIVIADFGAGPLSASVGFLATVEHMLSKNRNLTTPKKITIYAIDRSEKMVDMGAKLLQKSLTQHDLVSVQFVTSPLKIEKKIDIALCSNIFNEIPEKHRLKTLLSIYERLNDTGILLILEPAQDVHSKALGTLRDSLIESKQDCYVISPCSHKKACPMSSKTTRSDWCWFRHFWKPPTEQSWIDKLTRIDHVVLNYSYVFFRKSLALGLEEEFYARVVSNPFKLNQDSSLDKILLCTEDGVIDSILIDTSLEKSPYHRGNRIMSKDEIDLI